MTDSNEFPSESQTGMEPGTTAPLKPTSFGRSELGAAALAVLLYALLVDAAIETFLSGSPVRLLVAATVAAYLILTVGIWRFGGSVWRSFGWWGRASASGFVLLGLLVWTVWLPDGLTNGVAMLRQPTSVILSAVSALAVAVAGLVLVRVRFLPWWGRAALGLVALYGVVAFVVGAIEGMLYPNLFQGESLWRRLPYWLQGAFIGTLVAVPLATVAAMVDAFRQVRAADGRGWGLQQSLALALSALIAVSGFTMNAGPALAIVAQDDGAPQASLLVLPSVSIKPAAQPRTDPGTPATSSSGPLRSMTEANRLPAVLDALEKIGAGASRAAFDVAAKAEELGKDVERIFAFVRDDVRYEAYQGVLRGPRGALMARAGNSFDKALLLGALLGHQGVDVRYMRGRLNPDQAEALVSAMFQASKGADGGLVDDLTAVPGATEAAQELGGAIAERWGKSLGTVNSALERRQIRLASSPPVAPGQLALEASEHVWVEYRRDGEWVALDPSFREARTGASFGVGGLVHQSIPPSDHHQVTISVVVEERGSAGLSRREVLRHRRPAADLHGAAVALRFKVESAGLGWSAVPVLNIDTDSIDGQVIASSGMGASGQALGGRLFGALGGAATPPSSEVVALWLEVDFLTPGGRTETVRRALVDRVGPAAREDGRERTVPLAPLPEIKGAPLYLGNLYGLSFVSGALDARYAQYRASRHLPVVRQSVPLVAALQRGDQQAVEREARRLAPTMEPLMPQMVAQVATAFHLYSDRGFRLARQGRARADVWLYEASPRLAIASVEHRLAADGKAAVDLTLDLRRNDLRVVGKDLSSVQIISANAVRGTLDAALEHIIVSTLMPSADGVSTTSSTLAIIDQAEADGIAVEALTSRDEVTALRVSDDVKARMQRSLGEGAILIAPSRMVRIGGAERLAWWRIDLRTGETLGVTDTGLHAGQVGVELTLGDVAAMGLVVLGLPFAFLGLCWLLVDGLYVWHCAMGGNGSCARDYRGPVFNLN